MPTKKPADDGFISAKSKSKFTRNAVITAICLFVIPYFFLFACLVPIFIATLHTAPGQKPEPPSGWAMAGMGFFYLSFLIEPFLLAGILQGQINEHRKPSGTLAGKKVFYATLWQRGWAQLINCLLCVVPGLGVAALACILFFILRDPNQSDGYGLWIGLGIMACFLACMICGLYFVYLDGSTGQTPGRKWMKIRMLGTDMKPCGFWRTMLRGLAGILDSFFQYLPGALVIGFTRHQQRLGDLAADTIVIQASSTK